MIENLYSNSNFIDVIDNKKTVDVAYRFNDKTKNVLIISIKSDDSLISKIRYHIIRLFGGYNSLDLSVQKELNKKNIKHLFDLEKMDETTQKVGELQEETKTLSESKGSLVKEVGTLSSDLKAAKSALKESQKQLESSRKATRQYQEEYRELKGQENTLKQSIFNLNKEKSGLEGLILDREKKVSELGEEHWNKINAFLQGSDPAKYLKFLLSRMANLEIQLKNFSESCSSPCKYERSEMYLRLKEYIKNVPSIKDEIAGGVKSEHQKTKLLKKISSIDLCPNLRYYNERDILIAALKELVELNFRLHQINHTS